MDWSIFWTWVAQGALVCALLGVAIVVLSVPVSLAWNLISSSKTRGASTELIWKGGPAE